MDNNLKKNLKKNEDNLKEKNEDNLKKIIFSWFLLNLGVNLSLGWLRCNLIPKIEARAFPSWTLKQSRLVMFSGWTKHISGDVAPQYPGDLTPLP